MQNRAMRKSKEGFVIGNKMDKSVVVGVEQRYQHPLYKKIVTKLKKIVAHDEENRCKVGDKVMINETRPISKTKRWRVESIIGQKRMEGTNDTSTN